MRTVVVGASSGLGRCIGIDRGRRGDRVALLARRKDRLVDAAAEAGPGALAITCDVTDPDSCRSAIEEAAHGLGGLDALVYATGIGPLQPIEDIDAAVWRRAFETNVTGAALATRAALPFLEESRGVAAYMSTISASLTPPWPGFAAYGVSKAALDRLIDAFRVEHPWVGFTRVIMGDSAGGEGHSGTEFPNAWDMDHAARFATVWREKGYIFGTLIDVEELTRLVDTVLTCKATIQSVTLIPRGVG